MPREMLDDISHVVKNDELILRFGNRLCTKLRKDGNQQHYISNKMRELGCLVLEARKCCENIASLSDCLDPSNFDFVIEAVTDLSG